MFRIRNRNLITNFKIRRIKRLCKSARKGSKIRLNLGCGSDIKPGYINGDRYNENAEIIFEFELLPFKNDSFYLIETHHVFEHLSLEQTTRALKECYRILEFQGYLILSVPDLSACLRLFLKSPYHIQYDSIIKMIYGSQEHDGMYHKSGFTKDRIKDLLTKERFKIKTLSTRIKTRPTPSIICIAQKSNSVI